jgi:UDP-N-acetylmuramate--alanine ligase
MLRSVMQFISGQRIHCIGVGGFGISAIARILLLRGFLVSGSDRNSNAFTEALSRDGAIIFKGHAAEHVKFADMVIATSAVGDDHVEVVAARERGIPVYKRRDILTPLMEGNTVIAVAGTHGKTTTTSMIVHILRECGKDPSYIVGGILASTGTNAGVGKDNIFVIEADEYDNMFLGLKPNIAVITSIEYDHPDFFKSEKELYRTFEEFVDLIGNGHMVVCKDDPLALKLASQSSLDTLVRTYGTGANSYYRAVNRQIGSFEVLNQEKILGRVQLSIPGEHNIRNALAALRVAEIVSVPFECAAKSLGTFQSTGRRFDVRGDFNGVTVIDDYAHHPTAVKFTIEATRSRYPNHQIWAVWQPHMYSRTQQLIDNYATAFKEADHVVITDIYAAREDPIPGVDGTWTARQIQHPDVQLTPSLSDAVNVLVEMVKAPAVILIMSAGDAPQIGVDYLKVVRSKMD